MHLGEEDSFTMYAVMQLRLSCGDREEILIPFPKSRMRMDSGRCATPVTATWRIINASISMVSQRYGGYEFIFRSSPDGCMTASWVSGRPAQFQTSLTER